MARPMARKWTCHHLQLYVGIRPITLWIVPVEDNARVCRLVIEGAYIISVVRWSALLRMDFCEDVCFGGSLVSPIGSFLHYITNASRRIMM